MNQARLHTLLRYVAANVHRLRVARAFTQERLGELAEMDVRHLQRIERGTVNPSVGSLLALADSLSVSLETLFEPAELPPPRRGRPEAAAATGRKREQAVRKRPKRRGSPPLG